MMMLNAAGVYRTDCRLAVIGLVVAAFVTTLERHRAACCRRGCLSTFRRSFAAAAFHLRALFFQNRFAR
jgi:hypothetical protein